MKPSYSSAALLPTQAGAYQKLKTNLPKVIPAMLASGTALAVTSYFTSGQDTESQRIDKAIGFFFVGTLAALEECVVVVTFVNCLSKVLAVVGEAAVVAGGVYLGSQIDKNHAKEGLNIPDMLMAGCLVIMGYCALVVAGTKVKFYCCDAPSHSEVVDVTSSTTRAFSRVEDPTNCTLLTREFLNPLVGGGALGAVLGAGVMWATKFIQPFTTTADVLFNVTWGLGLGFWSVVSMRDFKAQLRNSLHQAPDSDSSPRLAGSDIVMAFCVLGCASAGFVAGTFEHDVEGRFNIRSSLLRASAAMVSSSYLVRGVASKCKKQDFFFLHWDRRAHQVTKELTRVTYLD
jgi:hypothetical protein